MVSQELPLRNLDLAAGLFQGHGLVELGGRRQRAVTFGIGGLAGFGLGGLARGLYVFGPKVPLHLGCDRKGAAGVVNGGVGQQTGKGHAVAADGSPDGAAQRPAIDERRFGPRARALGPLLRAKETAALKVLVELIEQLHPEVVQDGLDAGVEVHNLRLLK